MAHGACTGFKNMGDVEYGAALLGQEVQQILHGTFVWSNQKKPAWRKGVLVEGCSKQEANRWADVRRWKSKCCSWQWFWEFVCWVNIGRYGGYFPSYFINNTGLEWLGSGPQYSTWHLVQLAIKNNDITNHHQIIYIMYQRWWWNPFPFSKPISAGNTPSFSNELSRCRLQPIWTCVSRDKFYLIRLIL